MMQLPLDIAKLYNEGRPFAIYRLPGETRLRMAGTDGDELAIGLWNSPYDECIRVSSCGDGAPLHTPWAESTPHDEYLRTTAALVEGLKHRGGKCVRMRSICRTGLRLDLQSIAEELFGRFPDAFCSCYYTPSTGLWLGATPELLLDYDGTRMRTMSLAGTRTATPGMPWDSKNTAEQAYVTRFICDALSDLGLEPQCGPDGTLRYGAIEHICTRIEAEVKPHINLGEILDAISPTPAVAGTPRSIALGEIASVEDTPRRCYAGYLLHSDGSGRRRAYVNLRCAQISPEGYCIYAGGGITADSNPASEWTETEAKAAVLVDIMNRNILSPE